MFLIPFWVLSQLQHVSNTQVNKTINLRHPYNVPGLSLVQSARGHIPDVKFITLHLGVRRTPESPFTPSTVAQENPLNSAFQVDRP